MGLEYRITLPLALPLPYIAFRKDKSNANFAISLRVEDVKWIRAKEAHAYVQPIVKFRFLTKWHRLLLCFEFKKNDRQICHE
jgi:hypothetical protein